MEIKECVEIINKEYFCEIMPASYYPFIQKLYDEYNFSCDRIIKLFSIGKNKNALNLNYLGAIARNWHNDDISC